MHADVRVAQKLLRFTELIFFKFFFMRQDRTTAEACIERGRENCPNHFFILSIGATLPLSSVENDSPHVIYI